jgi:hypothetical protein
MDLLADIVHPNEAQRQQQQHQQPPQEEEEDAPMSYFDKELAWLKDQEYGTFQFLDAVPTDNDNNGQQQPPPNSRRWSMEQARDIYDALMASSVIQTLFAELEMCQPQAIGTSY